MDNLRRGEPKLLTSGFHPYPTRYGFAYLNAEHAGWTREQRSNAWRKARGLEPMYRGRKASPAPRNRVKEQQ